MRKILLLCFLSLFIYACDVVESTYKSPQEMLPPEAKPTARQTAMRQPLALLGEMSKVYGAKKLYIQCERFGDDTGAGMASGAEIPLDILEMIKTSVNSVGGNVFYVPYNPNYIIGQERTGYAKPKSKITPNIIISGAITEFDRALVGTDRKMDVGLPGKHASGGFGGGKGDTLSQITLDINLIDYDTMTMIPKMQAINTVMVSRGKKDAGFGFEIFGASLGYQSGVKYVQGRHAAVRALVELSVLESIGRYLNLPYWRYLPENKPDPLVIDNIRSSFSRTEEKGKVMTIQALLTKYGHKIEPTGSVDPQTEEALRKFKAKFMNIQNSNIDEETFIALYINIPVAGTSDPIVPVLSGVSEGKPATQAQTE